MKDHKIAHPTREYCLAVSQAAMVPPPWFFLSYTHTHQHTYTHAHAHPHTCAPHTHTQHPHTHAHACTHTQTTTGDDVKDFAKQLKNKLTRKYRRKPPKKTYLDYTIQGGGDDGPDGDTGESLVFNNVHTRISDMAQRLDSAMYSNSIAVLAQ